MGGSRILRGIATLKGRIKGETYDLQNFTKTPRYQDKFGQKGDSPSPLSPF